MTPFANSKVQGGFADYVLKGGNSLVHVETDTDGIHLTDDLITWDLQTCPISLSYLKSNGANVHPFAQW
eukprot:CAMPEP_0184679286 /NCGR_PEP_ID=MMETSP0312-20130426/2118_1 /TAXON_ID=31354 /ORGANISM="Compsopogon coeruleus, Strain SAG 36.94" /LENGTH=68 /DNA_ID=CAMNT_0027128633 /DNA_START=652 /DNA_END=855 /DNA_ORIENTATION=-